MIILANPYVLCVSFFLCVYLCVFRSEANLLSGDINQCAFGLTLIVYAPVCVSVCVYVCVYFRGQLPVVACPLLPEFKLSPFTLI